jgi:hypothetical protein
MNAARLTEHRITRDLLRRGHGRKASVQPPLAERIIITAAVIAGMVLLGSYARELLLALLAAAAVFTLGSG